VRIWRALAGVAARGGTLTRYALADRDAQEPAGPEGRGHDFHRGSHPPLHLIRERTIPEHRKRLLKFSQCFLVLLSQKVAFC
jgi:hypothetical protein